MAIATPGITFPFLNLLAPAIMPAMPPKNAISTSYTVGEVRPSNSEPASFTGLIRKKSDGKHIIVTSKMEYDLGKSELKVVVVGEPYDSLGIIELKDKMKEYGLVNTKLSLYQGDDGRVAARDMFGALDKDMQSTRSSIKDIYLTMDSIRHKLNKVAVLDTLQATIAREIKKSDSTLNRFTLRRVFSFNPSKNKNDTIWYALAAYAEPLTLGKKYNIEEWLKQRLKSPNVKFDEE